MVLGGWLDLLAKRKRTEESCLGCRGLYVAACAGDGLSRQLFGWQGAIERDDQGFLSFCPISFRGMGVKYRLEGCAD